MSCDVMSCPLPFQFHFNSLGRFFDDPVDGGMVPCSQLAVRQQDSLQAVGSLGVALLGGDRE